MTKFMRFIEALLLPTIAIVSAVISLGDVFNVFHLIPSNQVPMIILVITSMGLGTLAVIMNKCNEMQDKLELLSTSSLATSYLWNEKDMEDALARFIHEGGKIKQIFFVRSPEEAASPEMQVTLDLLKKIGITIRIVNSTRIPANLKQYFIVEARRKIGWDIPVNDQGHVGLSVITANPAVTANYCKIFETLWEIAEY